LSVANDTDEIWFLQLVPVYVTVRLDHVMCARTFNTDWMKSVMFVLKVHKLCW